MVWYDRFASFYDASLERLYRPHRQHTIAMSGLGPGDRVLDLACGPGQNFPPILDAIGDGGRLIGVDYSAGMLGKARRRADRHGWENVQLVQKDARVLEPSDLDGIELDAVVCTLGLSVLPDWESTFDATFALLRPGGRYTIFDVHAERWVPQTSLVQLLARAKLDRQVWTRLEALATDFTLEYLDLSPHVHGGRVFIATGTHAP